MLAGAIAGSQITDAAGQPTDTSVDGRTILTIGPHEFSAYFFDKYYTRFAQGLRSPVGSKHDAVRHWFSQFLVQQLVVVYAESLGFDQKPAVQNGVDRMRRYMLTKPEGPFYQTLYPNEQISDETLHTLHSCMANSRDVVLVHIQPLSSVGSVVSKGFSEKSDSERLKLLTMCRHNPEAVYIEGPISWPYFPFSEISEQLSLVPQHGWLEIDDSLLGYYIGFVRSISPNKIPDFERLRPFITQVHTETGRRKIQLRHRAQVLQEAAFEYRSTNAMQLIEALRLLQPISAEIPKTLVPKSPSAELARYVRSGQTKYVNVSDFIDYWNQQFIRTVPADESMLRQQIEDMVLEEADYATAIGLKIDQTPKFIEDRRGFTCFQVLDCFEKERLSPQVKVTQDEIERYYRANKEEFGQVTCAEGTLVELDPNSHDERRRTIQIALNCPSPLPDNIIRVVLSAPSGAKFGPFGENGARFFFTKDRNVRSDFIPIQDVADQIRVKLERPLLDELERKLAQQLAPKFTVVDNIPYERYDLTKGDVERPWSN